MTANILASTAAQYVSLGSSGFRYDLFAAMCKSAHGRSHVRDYFVYAMSFINFCFVSNNRITRSEEALKFFDFLYRYYLLLPAFYPAFISFVPSVGKNWSSGGGKKNMVFWDLAMSILVKYYQHFGETICLIFYFFPEFPSFVHSFKHSFHHSLFLSLLTVIFPFFPPSFVFVFLSFLAFILSVFSILLSHSVFRFLGITRFW